MAEAFLKAQTVRRVKEIPGKLFDIYDLRTTSEFTDPTVTKVQFPIGNNPNLTLVSMPGCSYYAYGAFAGCPNLSLVTARDCTMGYAAFGECPKLEKIIITGSWCNIENCMVNVNKVTDLYLLTDTVASAPMYYSNLKGVLGPLKNIYVTPSLYSQYAEHSQWKTILDMIHPYEGGI